MPNERPYYTTLPPVRTVLERLYTSMHEGQPAPDETFEAQLPYLKFVLPSPDHLHDVAVALSDETEGRHALP